MNFSSYVIAMITDFEKKNFNRKNHNYGKYFFG